MRLFQSGFEVSGFSAADQASSNSLSCFRFGSYRSLTIEFEQHTIVMLVYKGASMLNFFNTVALIGTGMGKFKVSG